MEFLRDENINNVGSVTETSEVETSMASEAETESRHGDPAVELEAPEAWQCPDNKDKETSGKRLIWLHVIGENMKDF